MEIQGFDPRGKTFNFRLDAYSCYKRKTGFCSLDNISIEELKNCSSCVHVNGESTIEYCRGMAKLFLDHKFKTPADIYYNGICGHYCCDGGQHRTCVVAHLLKKGADVSLNANVTEQDCKCIDCLRKEDFTNREKSLTFIDKKLKTKKYRCLKKEEKDHENYECMYTFD